MPKKLTVTLQLLADEIYSTTLCADPSNIWP